MAAYLTEHFPSIAIALLRAGAWRLHERILAIAVETALIKSATNHDGWITVAPPAG